MPGLDELHAVSVGGLLLGGCAVGVWLDARRTPSDDGGLIRWLAAAGVALVLAGYRHVVSSASLRPDQLLDLLADLLFPAPRCVAA